MVSIFFVLVCILYIQLTTKIPDVIIKYQISFLIFLLTILGSFHLHAQIYNHTIYLPSDSIDKDVRESVEDMAFWLGKASGQQLVIKNKPTDNNSTYSIRLLLVDEFEPSSEVKKQLSLDGQSFYLIVNGIRSAQIIGTGKNSFINGIYTFLQELGFRWYMPGDNWAIVPDLNQSIHKNIKRLYRPDFENRSYGGTGGMATIKGLDPTNTFKKDFDIWNRRNRFHSDYVMKGHSGQVFYTTNKDVLNAHPEYFCNGKVNPFGRIDISNPAAVDLYVDWALKQANPQNRFSVIGVEPADGSGGKDDCLPTGMPQIKSWSDKYFWLANQVAEKAVSKKTDALVELYAYSSHAAPPSFELHKNVYPVIFPEGFHNVAEPKPYIELWRKKMKDRPMGIYEYWNITQWSVDVPQFNIYAIPEKLRLWKKNNITTINLESTNAKGPMGHALWLAAQMMWDTRQSFDSLYTQFLKQCFGPAASDIKHMYDRWSLNYQYGMEVFLSLNDLKAASSKTSDPVIQKRISELKSYVHYLKLWYDYQDHPTNAGYKELIGYIYSIHHLRLLQTFPLQAYYIKPPEGFDRQSFNTSLLSGNTAVTKISLDLVEQIFKKDLVDAPSVYSFSKIDFDIPKARPLQKINAPSFNPKYLNGRNNYYFNLTKGQKIKLQVGASAPTRLTITDADEKVRFEKEIAGTKDLYESIMVDLPAGKYSLSFGDLYHFSRIIFPTDIVFFTDTKWYDNAGYPLLYVYVPKDVSEIVYIDKLGPGLNKRGDWIDPDGKHIKPVFIKYFTYRVPVAPQHRGKVWVLNIGHRSYRLLNIPNYASLNNFEYKE
jgi:hypothetical protein